MPSPRPRPDRRRAAASPDERGRDEERGRVDGEHRRRAGGRVEQPGERGPDENRAPAREADHRVRRSDHRLARRPAAPSRRRPGRTARRRAPRRSRRRRSSRRSGARTRRRAASPPTATKRMTSETIIIRRREKRSASAPPISTVASTATDWQTSTSPSAPEPARLNVRQPSASRNAASPTSETTWPSEEQAEVAARAAPGTRAAATGRDGCVHGPKLSSAPVADTLRVACVQLTQPGRTRPRISSAPSGSSATRPRRAPSSSSCRRSGTRSARPTAARGRGAARRRRVGRGDGRLGARARDHARRRLDHRAPRGPREALEHVLVFDPDGVARGRLPQDPPLRRRGRRPRLPRVGRRGARRRARRRARRGLAARADASATTSASRSCTGSSRSRAPSWSPCRRTSRSTRARTTGTCCCGRGRSRTSATSPPRRRSARRWPGRPSYGRSLIADPWGIVLAQAPDEETVIVAELDRARLRAIREQLPSLANRQPEAYRWPLRPAWLEALPGAATGSAAPELMQTAKRLGRLEPSTPFACGRVLAYRAELADGDARGAEAPVPAPRERARGGGARGLGRRRRRAAARARRRARARCCSSGCEPGTSLAGPSGRARRVLIGCLPRLWKPAAAPFRRSPTRPAWWASTSTATSGRRPAGRCERRLLDAALDALRELAADAGRAGARQPGPPRRERARRRARAVARDRPEAARRRARVLGRADRRARASSATAARVLDRFDRSRASSGSTASAPAAGRSRQTLAWGRDGTTPRRGRPLAAGGRVMLRAVLFDVDFTLARPGPELGPEGYARRPSASGSSSTRRATRRRATPRPDAPAPPRARPRRRGLGRLHCRHHPRHGRRPTGAARPAPSR